jgi:hypothetical protein
VVAARVERPDRSVHVRLLLQTFYALMRRDVRVLRKQAFAFVLRTAMQPFLLVFVFGYVLPKIGQGPARFADVLLPGLIGTAIIFQGIQAVALPLVQEFGPRACAAAHLGRRTREDHTRRAAGAHRRRRRVSVRVLHPRQAT